MTKLHLVGLTIAEAMAQDSSGAFTLVRVGMNVAIADEVPTNVRRVWFAEFISEEASGQTFQHKVEFEAAVRDPAGAVVASATGVLERRKPDYPELPGGVSLPLPLTFKVASFGTHVFTITLKSEGEIVGEAESALFVVRRKSPERDADE